MNFRGIVSKMIDVIINLVSKEEQEIKYTSPDHLAKHKVYRSLISQRPSPSTSSMLMFMRTLKGKRCPFMVTMLASSLCVGNLI
jgi:hypothetical protein